MKFYIDKYCDCASDDGDENKIRGEHADRCLEFLNLYSDISILRQLLIADMASVIGSFQSMDKLALNLLKLTDKEKLSDKDIVMFLLDPINNKLVNYFNLKVCSFANIMAIILVFSNNRSNGNDEN